MNLFYLWIIPHFLSLILIFKSRVLKIYELLILISLLFVYFLKDDSYDIINYLIFFSSPNWNFELLFSAFTILFVNFFSIKSEFIYAIWCIFIFILLFLSISKYQKNRIVLSIFIIGSLAFFLSTQNVIRQGISGSLIIFSLVFYFEKKFFISLISMITAIFFHKSSLVIISIVIIVILLMKVNKISSKSYLEEIKIFSASCLFSSLFYLIFFIVFPDSIYLDNSINWGEERTSSQLKILFLSIIYFISSGFFIKYFDNIIFITNSRIRSFLFYFLFFISPFDELFSRFLLYYLFFDLLYIILLFKSCNFIHRLTSLIIFIAYGLSPNVYNIINYSRIK